MKTFRKILPILILVTFGLVTGASLIKVKIDNDNKKFKQAFNIARPHSEAERKAIRPVLVKRLQEIVQSLEDARTKLDIAKKSAEALPANTPGQIQQRVNAFTECEKLAKGVDRATEAAYDAADIADLASMRDVATECGIPPKYGGAGPF